MEHLSEMTGERRSAGDVFVTHGARSSVTKMPTRSDSNVTDQERRPQEDTASKQLGLSFQFLKAATYDSSSQRRHRRPLEPLIRPVTRRGLLMSAVADRKVLCTYR